MSDLQIAAITGVAFFIFLFLISWIGTEIKYRNDPYRKKSEEEYK